MCIVHIMYRGTPHTECKAPTQVYTKVMVEQLRSITDECLVTQPNARPSTDKLMQHPWLAENGADGNILCELIDERALPPEKDKHQLHQAVAVVAQRAFNSVQELERQRPRA